MKDAKNIILVALALAIACGVAGVMIIVHQEAKDTADSATAKAVSQPEPTRATNGASPAAPRNEAPPTVVEVPASPPASPAAPSARSANPLKDNTRAPSASGSAGQGVTPRIGPLQDPLAREALALVGLDPIAEAYWYAAINNPNLPAKERQDLIEDLNEDGLSDPKHPGPDDLPVILSRIHHIEAVGPYVMDKVNADAFEEAYKDLVNLACVALGGGEPVR
jgi:hypothetical protein